MPLASRLLALATAACLIGAPALAEDHPEGLHVHDAYARVTGTEGASGAVFFTLHNHTGHDVTLTAVTTDLARMAGVHTHIETADGMMQMIAVEGGVLLPFGEMHEFARGGDHIMLMGLTRALSDGDIIPLTLVFDGAEPLVIEAVVDNDRAPDAAGTHDHSSMTVSP